MKSNHAGRIDHGTPGRHGPGDNVFAYFVGPEDFVIRYTAEFGKVDAGDRVREPRDWAGPPCHSELWGAIPPAQRAHEGRAKENRLRGRAVPPIK